MEVFIMPCLQLLSGSGRPDYIGPLGNLTEKDEHRFIIS